MRSSNRRQQGAALLVGLIMLVMLTLIILAAMTLSGANLRVVGNMQHRDEAIAAANMAIEQAIAINFPTINPPAVFQAVTDQVDIDRDGVTDFTIVVPQPTCLSSQVLPSNTPGLDPACLLGVSTAAGGLGGAAGTNSLCADTQWEIRATATHALTGANVTVRQGISRRMGAAVAVNVCG